MIIGYGIDKHDIRDVERRLGEQDFMARFTAAEKALCDGRYERAAAYCKRHCAKEAMMKAMGGNDAFGNVDWREIEVVNTASGRPTLRLSGGALAQFQAITPPGMIAVAHLSITDYYPTAEAGVIIEARKDPVESALAFAESHGILNA